MFAPGRLQLILESNQEALAARPPTPPILIRPTSGETSWPFCHGRCVFCSGRLQSTPWRGYRVVLVGRDAERLAHRANISARFTISSDTGLMRHSFMPACLHASSSLGQPRGGQHLPPANPIEVDAGGHFRVDLGAQHQALLGHGGLKETGPPVFDEHAAHEPVFDSSQQCPHASTPTGLTLDDDDNRTTARRRNF